MGAGEPAACPVPAAIAKAIFDAMGLRLRAMPFTPGRVKAALDTSDRETVHTSLSSSTIMMQRLIEPRGDR